MPKADGGAYPSLAKSGSCSMLSQNKVHVAFVPIDHMRSFFRPAMNGLFTISWSESLVHIASYPSGSVSFLGQRNPRTAGAFVGSNLSPPPWRCLFGGVTLACCCRCCVASLATAGLSLPLLGWMLLPDANVWSWWPQLAQNLPADLGVPTACVPHSGQKGI